MDLKRADLKGHVGMLSPANSGGVLALIALAESNGGSLENIEPGLLGAHVDARKFCDDFYDRYHPAIARTGRNLGCAIF